MQPSFASAESAATIGYVKEDNEPKIGFVEKKKALT
jgi:hypothetical protein